MIDIYDLSLNEFLKLFQEKGSFNLDIELKGLVTVEEATCGMFGK